MMEAAVAVWAVAVAALVVLKLPAKPLMRPRATSRRARIEIGEAPAPEVAARTVAIVVAAARKTTTQKGAKTRTLGSTSITTWSDLIMKR